MIWYKCIGSSIDWTGEVKCDTNAMSIQTVDSNQDRQDWSKSTNLSRKRHLGYIKEQRAHRESFLYAASSLSKWAFSNEVICRLEARSLSNLGKTLVGHSTFSQGTFPIPLNIMIHNIQFGILRLGFASLSGVLILLPHCSFFTRNYCTGRPLQDDLSGIAYTIVVRSSKDDHLPLTRAIISYYCFP